jgi:hypothetical protein
MGTKYSMVQGGKIWKWEKIPFFFPPLIFLQVFLSQVGKKLDQWGKYYIVSPQAHIQEMSRKEGKVNTKQHGQGVKHIHRGKTLIQNIFPQYTACESRTNCMA